MSKNIIDYRNKNKKFNTKKELLSVEGMTEDIYEKIKVYLVVSSSDKDFVRDESGEIRFEKQARDIKLIKSLDLTFKSRFLQDLQPRAGFLDGKYPGSRPKIYNQLNFSYNLKSFKLRGNATIEKDPGETRLADFSSGFISFEDFKFIKKFIVGDYILDFGQGIGMWSSLSFSKGTDAVNTLKKNARGLNGYTSVNEVQYFRGVASQFNIYNFDINLFYSNNYLDASIDTTLDQASTISYEGYHRTLNELSKENSIKEKLYGGRILYKRYNLKVGATYWKAEFSRPFSFDSLKQLYNFSGSNADMLSADYDFVYQNINLFGEWGRSQSGKVAGMSAINFTFYKLADLVLAYRYYPAEFAPLHSFGFGEQSGNTQNESGFYAGITFRPLKGLIVNTYFDQFKFPYRSYYNSLPVTGNDFLLNVDWKILRGFVISFKYKNENKEETRTVKDEFNRDTKKMDNRNQMNIRTGFIYEVSSTMRVRSRFDYVFVRYDNYGGNNKGIMFFTDFRVIPVKGLNLSTRVVFFQTDSYDSRLYEYEDDIKGVFSNIGLYGKGRRWYVLLKYKPFKFINLFAKYSETYIDGAKSIGTGDDEILNNINNRLNLGIEITL